MSLRSIINLVTVALLAASLVACKSSGDTKTEQAPSNPKKISTAEEGGLFSSVFKRKPPSAIVLPPDLVSSANDTVRENHDDAEQAKSQRVLPSVIGAEVIQEGGQRWLRVESEAQQVWDTLAQFWAEEEIELVEFKPAAGLMETDWIESGARSERDKKRVLANLFNRITGKDTAFDKFKIRLEREGNNVTNIFVTHRSTERQESNYNSPTKVTEWEWVEKDSDPEKVAQLLQVMVLLFESGNAGTA